MLGRHDVGSGRCCRRSVSVRNVWRAPFRATKSEHLRRSRICYVLYHLSDSRPRNDSVRNVWRVCFRSANAALPVSMLEPYSRRRVWGWISGHRDANVVRFGACNANCHSAPLATPMCENRFASESFGLGRMDCKFRWQPLVLQQRVLSAHREACVHVRPPFAGARSLRADVAPLPRPWPHRNNVHTIRVRPCSKPLSREWARSARASNSDG